MDRLLAQHNAAKASGGASASNTSSQQDEMDLENLLEMLEKEVLPLYYDSPKKWWDLVETSMKQVVPYFDSARMVDEYYKKLYK